MNEINEPDESISCSRNTRVGFYHKLQQGTPLLIVSFIVKWVCWMRECTKSVSSWRKSFDLRWNYIFVLFACDVVTFFIEVYIFRSKYMYESEKKKF